MPTIRDLMETYGLMFATLLLFMATYLHFLIAKREHKLRTNANLGFGPIRLDIDGWTSLILTQEVFNTGVSFVSIEEAYFEWNLYLDQQPKFVSGYHGLLPQHLAPGKSLTLLFRVDGKTLSLNARGELASIAEAISGSIIYKFKSVSNEICVMERSVDLPISPPRQTHNNGKKHPRKRH